MKKLNNYTKGDDPATSIEHDVSHGNVFKKLEFSKKKPLPSIEKDPGFADSVLSAATMHIRHKSREPAGPNTTKPQGPGQVLGPRTREVPRPGPGRRTPPIPPGPGPTQGPSGDLPPRKTAEGTHKRDAPNQFECHQQRQSLLNPPWRATCAVVEPTQAGSICFERLPRGLKQLKPVDMCYRHGHRRRLHNTLEESQRTDSTLRRCRAVVQQRTHGPKQRGDFNSNRANVGKTIFNTVGEEECRRPDNDVSIVENSVADKDTLDVSFRLTVGCMAVEDSLETCAASTRDQSEGICIDCTFDKDASTQASLATEEGILPQSTECKIDFSGDGPSVSPRKTSSAVTSQGVTEKTETDEMISNPACISEVEPGISDMELCRVIPSEPSLVVKAESLVSCRAVVGRLHTDERPKSFAALTDKEREKGNMAETNFNLQPLPRKNIQEEDSSDQIEDHKPPVCVILATDHPDVESNWDDTEDCQRGTGFHVAGTIGAGCDKSSPAVTAVNQLGTTPNLTQAEAGSASDRRSPSCEIKVEGVQETVPSAITGEPHAPMYSEHDLEEAQDAAQISRIQRAEPSSFSFSKETQKEGCETELLSFSVNSSRVLRATTDMAVTKNSPTENFESQDGKTEDFDGADSKQNDPRSQGDDRDVLSRSDRQESENSVRKSRAEVDPSPELQPSLSCHDIAIGVRFFKTPDNETKSQASNVESDNHPTDGEPFSMKNDRSSVQSDSDLNFQTERCTIRKIASQDNALKSKYLVLPDQDRVISGINMGSVRSPGTERQEAISQSYSQEDTLARLSSVASSEFPKDSINLTSRGKSESRSSSDVRSDSAAFRHDTVDRSSVVGIKRIAQERHSKQAIYDAEKAGKTEKGQEIRLQKKEIIRIGTGRKARTKTGCEIYPIHEDEEKDTWTDSSDCKDNVLEDTNNGEGVYRDLSMVKEEEDEDGEDDREEEDWFPPFVSPLPRAAAGGTSSGPPPEHAQQRKINFGAAESNRFFRIHGSNLQGDGPWGQGDRIERPGNYVEPTISLEDMSTRFFTDTTPLDLAFNAVNVVNSCSNSISYHSCHNQKRLLAALDGLKSDDVYKHALICPLARQCAAATQEFSQSLHKVFRRYSNRARAAHEALIEYYRALAAGEVTSPEMQRQIQRDGRRLYMVWEGGRYVTRYADGATPDSDTSADSSAVETTRPS